MCRLAFYDLKVVIFSTSVSATSFRPFSVNIAPSGRAVSAFRPMDKTSNSMYAP